MIKKLKIKNFKSLRDVEIELGKFTVLIGPNASGKSNLLDSLIFLSQSVNSTIDSTSDQRGGFKHIVFGGEGEEFEISIELLLDGRTSNYLLSVNKGQAIERERLVIADKIVIERRGAEGKLLSSDGTMVRAASSSNRTIVCERRGDEHYPLVWELHDYLSSWKIYQVITSEMRKVLPAKRSFNLDKSGANLAQVLISLYTERPRVFRQIEEILKQGIPEVEELLVPLTPEGHTFVALRVRGFEQKFDYYQLSDGTFKLLAYITAMALAEQRLVCFEEPENFIHPELLGALVEVLKKSEKQVILSTHSPYFVDFVQPEDIRVVEKEEGETRVSKVKNLDRLKEALKEMGLGELWYSGEIGGVP